MRGRATTHPTLISALWPTGRQAEVLRWILLVVGGSLLMTASAKIQVPFWPVPMTMQTFAALVIGATFGPRLGFAAVVFYLLQGAVGLPVFAGGPEKGIGLAYLAGPTGGYLIGCALAAWVVGTLARRGWDRTLGRSVAAFLIGDVVIFTCGMTWLGMLIGADKVFAAGLLPFLPGEVLKIALAAVLLPAAWRLIRARRD